MIRTIVRIAILAAAVAAGWSIGRAQTSGPDFELVVDAPAGETTVECRRGCELSWVERGLNPNARPMQTFQFRCGGPSGERCSSHRIGGWVKH